MQQWRRPVEEVRNIAAGILKRVKTSKRYSDTVMRFFEWAAEQKWTIDDRDAADYVGYLFAEHVRSTGKPKTWVTSLGSAIKFYDPRAREEGLP